MRLRLLLTLVLLLPVLLALPAGAAERVALVIGNGGYQSLRTLSNPGNDAGAVAKKLAGLGFTLIGADGRPAKGPVLNLGGDAFLLAVKGFAQAAQGAEIAFLYYAGHGMQIAGHPYLLPVDVPRTDIDLIQQRSQPLEGILKRLDGRAKLTLAVFDACREIPELEPVVGQAMRDTGLGADAYRGLARVQQQSDSQRIVAYAAAAGRLAADGQGRPHSPYTEALLAELDDPGREVGDLFRQVAYRLGRGGQGPEVLIQGVPPGVWFLGARAPLPAANPVPSPIPGPVSPPPALGHLQVSVDAAGARVLVNGQERGLAEPGKPLNLANEGLGPVQLEVAAPGRERVVRTVTLAAGTWSQVPLRLAVVEPGAGEVWTEPKTGMAFVRVPKGTFTMGCGGAWAGECDTDEKPAHQVAVKGFWMAKTEVTQAHWQRVMGSNPSQFKDCDDCPVEQVSWDDAQAFIARLDPDGGQGLRLPTEAEWEYACRSGGKDETYCGGSDLDRLAWYDKNSGNKTHPVAGKAANGLGLYDMSGNVWEWCQDWYAGYPANAVENPAGPETGQGRVARGGGWIGLAWYCRSARRDRWEPADRYDWLGFRLARGP